MTNMLLHTQTTYIISTQTAIVVKQDVFITLFNILKSFWFCLLCNILNKIHCKAFWKLFMGPERIPSPPPLPRVYQGLWLTMFYSQKHSLYNNLYIPYSIRDIQCSISDRPLVKRRKKYSQIRHPQFLCNISRLLIFVRNYVGKIYIFILISQLGRS